MDYKKQAEEFMKIMHSIGHLKGQKKLSKAFGGGTYILQLLYFKKEISPTEISEKMNISTARVATALNLLEEKQLIVREIDQLDRRRITVKLTEEGNLQAKTIIDNILDKSADIFRQLGEEETNNLMRIIKKISKIMQIEHNI